MVKIYERLDGMVGDQVRHRDVILTDAGDSEQFVEELAFAAINLVIREVEENDIVLPPQSKYGPLLGVWADLPEIMRNAFDIIAKLKGYKSDRVQEQRLMCCGGGFPSGDAVASNIKE